MVRAVKDLEEYKKLIEGDKPVIVDFWATWCGPCKMISPHFEKMAGTTEGVEFIKVDVDDAPEISEFAGIRAMPTFIAYSKGKDIKTVTGAKPAELKAAVELAAAAAN
ncbi:putative thioredoxin [Filobasidium floriforme]|uniref:putative thioredoxin n=1 Tax=Filobasidium floriforme TaxID=5210 RepID=UPI001E8CFA28|nr:putative thioredoxin [Filobasidium floriforme]KAH8088346.1 putative thioredoxin [Filobasidium floriforme]